MSGERIECDVLVIGAGVVGLSIGAECTAKGALIVVESHAKFGQETSSRNSEVVHSGIYYPPASQKTALCIEGRKLLYPYCEANGVPFGKMGKYVIATDDSEMPYIEKLAKHAAEMDVPAVLCSGKTVLAAEPSLKAVGGVFFSETGIVDSHVLMAVFERKIAEAGGHIAYRHRVTEIARNGNNWLVQAQGPDGEVLIETPVVINSAGLGAAELSNLALQTKRYEHRFCRGRYFGLSARYRNHFKHLVYPVPPKDGLGVHVTLDLDGYARLGPDVDWTPIKNYSDINAAYDCDWDVLREPFASAVRRYWPAVPSDALAPGMIGVRPKLFIDGKASPDFLMENHSNFIQCLGIESPGLTSNLAIARKVAGLF